MPSLMPGVAGAKEAYGISRIRDGNTVNIPPGALDRYEISQGEKVILTTTHPGEGGFNLWVEEKARKTPLYRVIGRRESMDSIEVIGGRSYARTLVNDGSIRLSPGMMKTFLLETDERLLVVKSAAVAMSFIPVRVWRKKMEKRGFFEAAKKMDELEEF